MPDSPETVSAPPKPPRPRQTPVIREQLVLDLDSGHRTVMSANTPENWDPNGLNQHVQILWEDIIGEPEGAHSPLWVWRLSRWCFLIARYACYTVLSILIAPPCALLLGCGFACIAFTQIWCVAPFTRCVKIYCVYIRTIMVSCMAATIMPAADAVGHVFRHIRINVRKDAPEDPNVLFI